MAREQQIIGAKLPTPRLRKPGDLRPAARNARTHSRKQVRQIADSIRAFGFTNPVLVDREGEVIAGHGRLAAAQLLGLEHVPTLSYWWPCFGLGEGSPSRVCPRIGGTLGS